jgi:hypothetical protein
VLEVRQPSLCTLIHPFDTPRDAELDVPFVRQIPNAAAQSAHARLQFPTATDRVVEAVLQKPTAEEHTPEAVLL